MKKTFATIVCTTLLLSMIIPIYTSNAEKKILNDFNSDNKIEVLSDDLLRFSEPLDFDLYDSSGPGPGYYDTSEYMIGSAAVGVIFLESNGAIDPNTENWISTEQTNVINEITQALNWWSGQSGYAGFSYTLDIHYNVQTSYEPIIHPCAMSNPYWEKLWICEAMAYLGYSSGDWMQRTLDYSNAIRNTYNTDWAFTIYVVDSSADIDGCFSDGFFAYAFLGGPYFVMTYDNDGWGITAMDQVCAHETGHIFWATDEYDGYTEYSGYLNAADVEGSGCLMDTNALVLSSGTKLQIGWQDTDGDHIHDIIDTYPETVLDPYYPNPSPNPTLTYTGNAYCVPYPNNNPQPHNPGNDVTINYIPIVFYQIDGGYFYAAAPVDGIYDSPEEDYSFTTPPLPFGMPHTILAVAVNSVGNSDQTPAVDTVIIDNPPDDPMINGPNQGNFGKEYTYTFSTNDQNGDMVYYWIDWGDSSNTGWIGPYPPGITQTQSHTWTQKGTYDIQIKSKDTFNMESGWTTLQVSMPVNKPINFYGFPLLQKILERFPNAFPVIRQIIVYM